MDRLGFIGTGSMGSMLIKGLIDKKAIPMEGVGIINRSQTKPLALQRDYPGLRIYDDHRALVEDSNIIFICVKPADLPDVLARTGREFSWGKIIISTLLAPPLQDLEKLIKGKLVRIYPGITQSTGRGVTLVTWGHSIEGKDREKTEHYLSVLGKYYELPESLYRAAGDVTSCGPAFMAAMVNALVQEAVKHGIEPGQAGDMALETMLGTALLMEKQGISFADLIRRVATPGGCTAEGLKIINGELPSVIDRVYEATCRREAEIIHSLRKDLL